MALVRTARHCYSRRHGIPDHTYPGPRRPTPPWNQAQHALEVNYRCPVAVVDAAKALLGYNNRRVAKTIRSGPGAALGKTRLATVRHTPDTGASELVEVVQAWLDEPTVRPADIAVLTRVNSLLLAPHVALARAGVPVLSVLHPDVLQRTGVRAALAWLRVGANPDAIRGDDLAEVYRRPSRGFPNGSPSGSVAGCRFPG